MEQPAKEKLIKRLRNPYRLSVVHDGSFKERFSLRLTPMNVLLALLGLLIVSGGLVYVLVALTSLREYVVPGYSDQTYRENAVYSRVMVDSLKSEVEKRDQYITDLRIVLSGGIVAQPIPDTTGGVNQGAVSDYQIIEEDSVLREQVDQESPFGLGLGEDPEGASLANLHLFKPLEGTLSSGFDRAVEHYGIDVVAPENSQVKAVRAGTVVMAGYTINGGYEIHVQHDQNILSIYKHNSKISKEVGDRVEVGEAIAVVGNTGDHTDGPHLHFELWIDGVAVDPEDYLSFPNVAD